MIPYTKYSYLWPPRPEVAIARIEFHRYADWWVTVKKQGTCNIIWRSPERQITAMNRHHQPHKAWKPADINSVCQVIRDLPGSGWYAVEAELMHSKVPGLRNINYIHDILVANGEYLVGVTYADRQQLLRDLFKPSVRSMTNSHYVIDPHTWLAINHRDASNGKEFLALFQGLGGGQDEGLVFKDPKAKLKFCVTASANSGWQVKSRIATKSYSA